ncbi:hypothetical protein GBAR_LOCUS1516 [Geodia barretti]|uniref:Uncharacterized protein n=1 Tax=Geodia barretti TaxID=519541 RepID=A0AA35QXP6_GEOBA|nr:hypothetical protein GBAR_LOCUS1516 [Geodia barretti]
MVVGGGPACVEYQACMESMRTRILELEGQLEWREGEGDSLCTDLRAMLKEEKTIREEMVSVEHRLLLNAVERQKHTATIRLLCVASTPSPLPPSSLSPLPTTLEDTGLASLLFKRSSNWFAEPSHMTEPYLSMEDITAPRGVT